MPERVARPRATHELDVKWGNPTIISANWTDPRRVACPERIWHAPGRVKIVFKLFN